MFDEFPDKIYNLLLSDVDFINRSDYIYYNMNQNVANFFWEYTVQKKRSSDNRFNVNEMDKVPQPLGDKSVESLQSFLRSKILPENFMNTLQYQSVCLKFYINQNIMKGIWTGFKGSFKQEEYQLLQQI